MGACLLKLLANENIASKAAWVEQYDQEVQAATHIKPFVGKRQRVPGDGAVLGLAPHGGEETNAIAIGHGLAPTLSLHDPYIMAQYSVDEAVRNVVAMGGDIETLCLLDNFCWPDPVQSKNNPEGSYRLGQLVRACRSLYDIGLAYGTPLVSGKDSMKNNFKGFDRGGRPLDMAILPTLLITAMAKTDVRFTTTPEFQNPGDVVYCLGGTGRETLLGSELAELFELPPETLPPLCDLSAADLALNARLYRTLHTSLRAGEIQSCHDVSEGGILVALCEGLFEGRLGLNLQVEAPNPLTTLFHQGPDDWSLAFPPTGKMLLNNALPVSTCKNGASSASAKKCVCKYKTGISAFPCPNSTAPGGGDGYKHKGRSHFFGFGRRRHQLRARNGEGLGIRRSAGQNHSPLPFFKAKL